VKASQPSGILTDSEGPPVQPSHAVAENSKNFVTRLLPGSCDQAAKAEGDPRKALGSTSPEREPPGTAAPTATTPTVGDLTALRGGRDRLLPVGEVAAKLGVCTATVYRLCERGDLLHVRVINSIRVRPRDLAAFVAAAGAQNGR